MPISKSAKKALRSSEHKASLNRYRKELIKAALKNITPATAAKAVSMIDKGAKWGLFHPNKAARMKSSLAKKIDGPIVSTKVAVTKSPAKPTKAKPPTKPKTNPPAGGHKAKPTAKK